MAKENEISRDNGEAGAKARNDQPGKPPAERLFQKRGKRLPAIERESGEQV